MSSGIKYDKGKLDWSLLEWRALEGLVKVLSFGEQRYGRENWKDLDRPEARYLNALMRHAVKIMQGQNIDPDSGQTHLSHIMCNAMFLQYFHDKRQDAVLAAGQEHIPPYTACSQVEDYDAVDGGICECEACDGDRGFLWP